MIKQMQIQMLLELGIFHSLTLEGGENVITETT